MCVRAHWGGKGRAVEGGAVGGRVDVRRRDGSFKGFLPTVVEIMVI